MRKYNTKFLNALKFTLRWEGGYSNHPNDSGGSTNKGITQHTYNTYRRSAKKSTKSVKLITNEEVQYIYYTFYYLPSNAFNLSNKLSVCVFDTAVHSGVKKALILLNNNNTSTNYINARTRFLRRISRGKNRVFLKGWLNRIDSLKEYIKPL